jgi:hypothetical protein
MAIQSLRRRMYALAAPSPAQRIAFVLLKALASSLLLAHMAR